MITPVRVVTGKEPGLCLYKNFARLSLPETQIHE